MDKPVEWPTIGMSLAEAAKALRIDPRGLRRAIRLQGLPARRIGRKWRISPKAVEAWLAAQQPSEDERAAMEEEALDDAWRREAGYRRSGRT